MLFAVSADETRYNLSGVYIESPAPDTVRFVVTDGHRLSFRSIGPPRLRHVAILPRKGLSELRNLLSGEQEVRRTISAKAASLSRAGTQITMRRCSAKNL